MQQRAKWASTLDGITRIPMRAAAGDLPSMVVRPPGVVVHTSERLALNLVLYRQRVPAPVLGLLGTDR